MDNQNELVFQAQDGKKESLEKLLFDYGYRQNEPWTMFLGKYLSLLKYGKINLRDKDTRRFLQLYIKDEEIRRKLRYHYQDYRTTIVSQETANYLQEKCSIIPEEDLKQHLVLLFIESVMKFKVVKKDVDFNGYLYNTYRFRVFEYFRVFVFKRDMLLQPLRLISDVDIPEEQKELEPQEAWLDRFYASELDNDRLGIFWINGRCGSLFQELTPFERTVLRDRYFLKKTDGQIAEEYGYHINTIYKRRHAAIEKLKKKKEETLD